MTGISDSSNRKIRNEGSDKNGFVSPGKKKVKATVENADLDSFDLDVIRTNHPEFLYC